MVGRIDGTSVGVVVGTTEGQRDVEGNKEGQVDGACAPEMTCCLPFNPTTTNQNEKQRTSHAAIQTEPV
jgi:hypothetical protein